MYYSNGKNAYFECDEKYFFKACSIPVKPAPLIYDNVNSISVKIDVFKNYFENEEDCFFGIILVFNFLIVKNNFLAIRISSFSFWKRHRQWT